VREFVLILREALMHRLRERRVLHRRDTVDVRHGNGCGNGGRLCDLNGRAAF
jgi:hypothetical protein